MNQFYKPIINYCNQRRSGKMTKSKTAKASEPVNQIPVIYLQRIPGKETKSNVAKAGASTNRSPMAGISRNLGGNESGGSDSEEISLSLDVDLTSLKKGHKFETAKLESAQAGAHGSITKFIRCQVKNMSSAIVILGVPKGIWFLDTTFISAHCKTLYKANYPGKKVPLWLSTVQKWNLRGAQHGPNACMRSSKGKVVPVLGW